MKKIIYILLLALVLTGCGKVDKPVKEETVNDIKEEVVQDVKVEEDLEETEDTTQTDVSSNTDNATQTEVPPNTAEKVTMYAKSSVNVRSGAGTSNSKIGGLTKGQEIIKIGEENGWSKIEFNGGVGYVKSEYLSTEKVQVSTPNNQGNNQTSGNNASDNSETNDNASSNNNQGSNNGGSTTSGMYHPKDAFAIERLDKCANILKGGLVGDAKYEYNLLKYFDGHIWISANSTSGAWMYIKIGYWDTNAQIASEEMKPCYNEIPVLMKQCFEALALEGGTELYNTINSLIHQYGGPRKVPTQGIIQESIPGLSIDVKKGKNGLELRFFAE